MIKLNVYLYCISECNKTVLFHCPFAVIYPKQGRNHGWSEGTCPLHFFTRPILILPPIIVKKKKLQALGPH